MMLYFLIYFVVINILSFFWFKRVELSEDPRDDNQIVLWISRIIPLLGGALGVIFLFGIFEREYSKRTWFWHIYSGCLFIMQLIVVLILFLPTHTGTEYHVGLFSDGIAGAFEKIRTFVYKYKWFWIYLVGINIYTFVVFAIDKARAIDEEFRISLARLIIPCFLGGTIGGLAGMFLLRHKTRKIYFSAGVPMILITHIIAFAYLVYIGVLR